MACDADTIRSYVDHEYNIIQSLGARRTDAERPEVAPEDRFFTYKHYLDGNGELIDPAIMMIIAKAMIRNKPDSYCQAWDVMTTGISDLVADLVRVYGDYGVDAATEGKPAGTLLGCLGKVGPARLV